MLARGITAIVPACSDLLKDSVAGVNKRTGVMYLNLPLIKQRKLTDDQVYFIMLHEMGHIVLQTSDEKAVDDWAHQAYMNTGRSLKQSVFAITRNLRFDNPQDFERGYAQLQRAQQYDNEHNR